VDCVIFSYALTMIPDWFLAIDNALSMLKPGGYLGVVDFFVSRKHPEPGCVRHGRLTRMLWPLWFAHDGVHLSSDHPAYLGSRCVEAQRLERMAHVPLLPGVKVPYYLFVGRKPPLSGMP
jgi:S-adenosylmethionine-diacylgycerolhomoserine-N-methlytransferase